MNFTIEQYGDRAYLTYPLSQKDGTDPLLMGMLLNNRIPGFADFGIREIGGRQALCYDIRGLRSMKDLFARTVSRHTLLNTFHGILSALESAQDYMIEVSSVVLDPQYIFLDPTTLRTALICLPLMEYRNGNDEKSFFKSVMFNAIFNYNESCDHVARIMNDLNSPNFDTAAFRELLEELGARTSPAPEAAPEQESFFDFSIPAPREQSSSPMEEAETLPSAPLFQPETPAPEPVSTASTEPAADPLSIADQLLSAALAPEPAPREAESAAPAVPTAPREEGASARSRRARARREGKEPEAPVQPSPVVEAPKAAPASDPFDFSDFVPMGSSKKTDAMKAADAILSALDLPTKEDKSPTAFDPFASLPSCEKEDKELPLEDPFADFTTPIVTSRSRTGTGAAPKAAEPPKATPPAREPESAEQVFDFSLPSQKSPAVSDAMRIADDLLSAALAGISTPEPAAPVAQIPPAPTKEPVETAPSYSLDFFSSAPSKKTSAMLEAEAILDSLDLSAPLTEEPLPAAPEAPVEPASKAAPLQEPVRKGGFFSKLRKKEEAPAPAPQTPAQPVVPYFGAEGETTILNLSAQPTAPSAPYLIRSSNGETIVLSKAVFRIGKDRDFVDYCIWDNSAISRRHANLMVRNGDVFIIDTNSTNHTYVNGVMIRSNAEVKLTHGDEIRLANEDFVLYCAVGSHTIT